LYRELITSASNAVEILFHGGIFKYYIIVNAKKCYYYILSGTSIPSNLNDAAIVSATFLDN
jgi:uncharacterized protein YbcV (DUF1398 family)